MLKFLAEFLYFYLFITIVKPKIKDLYLMTMLKWITKLQYIFISLIPLKH